VSLIAKREGARREDDCFFNKRLLVIFVIVVGQLEDGEGDKYQHNLNFSP